MTNKKLWNIHAKLKGRSYGTDATIQAQTIETAIKKAKEHFRKNIIAPATITKVEFAGQIDVE